MKNLLSIIVLVAAAMVVYGQLDGPDEDGARTRANSETSREITTGERATERRTQPLPSGSNGQEQTGRLEGSGVVVKVLADDNDGNRHQRFILRRDSGGTILVAHNIDVAPRIPGLRQGDTVTFSGEFEWNSKGGVVHWTHHDPAGRHVAGWLRHEGDTYQ
ncbi:MAG: DUF3465 domain-containing protein [Lysobacterales bacterium]